MSSKIWPLIVISIFSYACSMAQDPWISSLEKSHKKELFMSHRAVAFDIDLEFNEKKRLEARITMLTNSSKVRIDRTDGTTYYYDGEKVYQTPKEVNNPKARFDMFTWSYFFALPYKLSDPGTNLKREEFAIVGEQTEEGRRLTFGDGVGDSPDDWYLLYKNEKNKNRLELAAYIVTLDKPESKWEEDPHAILYSDFQEVEGVPIASLWTFWEWRPERGITRQLGTGHIKNITFLEVDEHFFSPKGDSKLIE